MNNDFNDIICNRHSVKYFNKNTKITHKEIEEIIEKATLAPSSVNMQPWRFLVVESEAGKQKLSPLVQFNQSQNDTSSAMIIIFGDTQAYKNGTYIFEESYNRGIMPEDIKNEKIDKVIPKYMNFPRQKMLDTVRTDCSLVAMQLMLVARNHGYDTNPIGGFQEEKIAEAFNLDKERYIPIMIVAIGEKEREPHQSIRLPINKVLNYA